MKIETTEQGVEILNKAIPYADQITNYKFLNEDIYFYWRSDQFKLEISTGRIDQVDGACLVGSNIAIVMTELVKRQMTA